MYFCMKEASTHASFLPASIVCCSQSQWLLGGTTCTSDEPLIKHNILSAKGKKRKHFRLWLCCSTSTDWLVTRMLPPTPCQLFAGNIAVVISSNQEGNRVYQVCSEFRLSLSVISGRLPCWRYFQATAGEVVWEGDCCTIVALNKFHVRTAPRGPTDPGQMPLKWQQGVGEGIVKLGHENLPGPS